MAVIFACIKEGLKDETTLQKNEFYQQNNRTVQIVDNFSPQVEISGRIILDACFFVAITSQNTSIMHPILESIAHQYSVSAA
jgi:hypothetical protein